MASPDLLRLRGGDPRPAIDRGFGNVRGWRGVAENLLWTRYETCPAELYLMLGKRSEAYDDVCEAICEAILHSLGYVCVVTEGQWLFGDEPLVDWVRTSSWRVGDDVPILH